MYARKLFGKEVSASSAPPVPAKRDRHADAVVSRRLFEDKLQAQLTEADQAELIAEEEQKAQDVFTTRDAVLKVKFNNLDDSRCCLARSLLRQQRAAFGDIGAAVGDSGAARRRPPASSSSAHLRPAPHRRPWQVSTVVIQQSLGPYDVANR
mmetsp:Transcript_118343/g.379356  ORF Transcript_118343/g.379356 Transcript_118343/m.379356 type:complete len:152 (+) Transcript_118343:790-1245(+)